MQGGGTIGQYRLTGLIGQGGMGAVYAGEHVILGRPAAVKVLLPELSQTQDIVMRFFNEARAATAIRHPGIVEIYDFGWSADGAAFIVMELLEGETLASRSSRERLGWRAALAIVRQIAGALGAAHAKGIVHRDLKPDNIFLVRDPEVPGGERIKLLDFGIAKLAGESSSGMNVTRTGAMLGTPTYMSPEQCRGVPADHRADLYALGCIVFELCSGRPPFAGEATGDVLAAHIHVPAPELAPLTGDVPPEVERLVQHLVQRLLAKVPAERVQSAEELIREIDAITIDAIAGGTRSAATASSGRLPVVTSPSITTLSGATDAGLRAPGRRGRSIAIGATTTTVITVAILMMARQGRGEEVPSPAPAASPLAVATRSPEAARIQPMPVPARTPPAPSPATLVALLPQQPAPPATVEVAIETVPAGAQILLGGLAFGKTPFHGTLPRRDGDVTLVIRLAGYVEKSVVVRAGQSINEHIKLVGATPVHSFHVNRDQSINPFGED